MKWRKPPRATLYLKLQCGVFQTLAWTDVCVCVHPETGNEEYGDWTRSSVSHQNPSFLSSSDNTKLPDEDVRKREEALSSSFSSSVPFFGGRPDQRRNAACSAEVSGTSSRTRRPSWCTCASCSASSSSRLPPPSVPSFFSARLCLSTMRHRWRRRFGDGHFPATPRQPRNRP